MQQGQELTDGTCRAGALGMTVPPPPRAQRGRWVGWPQSPAGTMGAWTLGLGGERCVELRFGGTDVGRDLEDEGEKGQSPRARVPSCPSRLWLR